MAATHRAPKQWSLTKKETVTSFEGWRQNLVYTLSLDQNFAPFLVDGFTWEKKTRGAPLRGFTDDPPPADGEPANPRRQTAQQKINMLELMLGQIANYCPIVSRNTVVRNSTSVANIWQTIRLHFGFQSTGGHFLDLAEVRLEPDERPEDLYQRLVAFVEDNLLRTGAGISHHGEQVTEDEELSPTLENMIILTWLRLIHPELPKLVKQRYGTELRSRSLASIKPEVSQALDSLLEEVKSSEDARIMRTATFQRSYNTQAPSSGPKQGSKPRQHGQRNSKSCPLCQAAKRPNSQHFLSECPHLPETDRRFMLKARQIVDIIEHSDESGEDPKTIQNQEQEEPPVVLRVQVRQSPYLDTFHDHHAVRLVIDSGATGNMIRESFTRSLGIPVNKTSQSASQADGSSPLNVVGETRLTLTRDNREFELDALVVSNLDVNVLAGTPFMESNDVAIRPAKHEVLLGDGTRYTYGSTHTHTDNHQIRRAHVIRGPNQRTTIWPGNFIEVSIPTEYVSQDSNIALEPRIEGSELCSSKKSLWPPPAIMDVVDGKIRIPNLTDEPVILVRNAHFCQVSSVHSPNTPSDPTPISQKLDVRPSATSGYSNNVVLDPDHILSTDIRREFLTVLQDFDSTFCPEYKGYNGASGPFEAKVNMGPVLPPQRKGRLPQYSRDKLLELQDAFDRLESLGVFRRPEDIGVSVEYLNPSFLVKKPSGGFRLVTAFADVGRYSKPQPSLLPDVDGTLRHIGRWNYLIATDLASAFYQIPLARESMKYCGVATPFKGVRVYTRSAMGIPGSETALEELMCRVLGDLLHEGIVVKLADDLYCGADNPHDLLKNWRRVLEALHTNGLCLSAAKTIIAPKATTILGWTWSAGTLTASKHRISTLASCSPPENVKGLRSFIGAFKVLARVIPHCSSYLSPLDDAVAGMESKAKIPWTDELRHSFTEAQRALSSSQTITLPRPQDQLWIVTDGAVRSRGIGATLYITRDGKLHLGGYFSAKLKKQQVSWLPCEVEALAIAIATRHYSPYIIQALHPACVLTDSKPCVQAYEKLCRGEFSASPRVSTFLSVVSRYQASVRHVAGVANLPSDHASRNSAECFDDRCQVCSFVKQSEESVVRHISFQDLLSGEKRFPYTSRPAWRAIQSECPDLRRVHAHLKQGTRPSKKLTNIRDVKRYLNTVTISRDGLLIVVKQDPLSPVQERIVVPRQILDGLMTALHIQLSHPTCHQMKLLAHRYFYALDMDRAIDQCCSACYSCAALRKTSSTRISQSTENPPKTIGQAFAADCFKQHKHIVLVLRECVTSYTMSMVVTDEKHDSLRDGLIRLCVQLQSVNGPPAIIRVDPAPGFQKLVDDKLLMQHRISVEIGRVKNPNKNPVAEKAVQELQQELIRVVGTAPADQIITPRTLAIATANLNNRIRSRGLSAREMLWQRDQFTNCQIPVNDRELIEKQQDARKTNHPHSERSKAPQSSYPKRADVNIGDLVFLYADKNKLATRQRYLVTEVQDSWCSVRKFVGSQLRSATYKIKTSECYKVPVPFQVIKDYPHSQQAFDSDDDAYDEREALNADLPNLPDIPVEISASENSEYPTLAEGSVDSLPTSSVVDHHEIASSQLSPEKDGVLMGDSQTAPRRSSRTRRTPMWHKDYIP